VAGITFQKRQKEMKRLEKQRAKAERRAQRKLEKSAGSGTPPPDESAPIENTAAVDATSDSEPQGRA